MFSRLLSCRRGAVGVEAALVFPVLIALVMGTMEFGLMIFTYSAMQSAAREATREVAVNFATAASLQKTIADKLPLWSRPYAQVAVTQSNPGDPASNVIRVQVSMPAGDATPVPFFSTLTGEWELTTEVVMKQELPL